VLCDGALVTIGPGLKRFARSAFMVFVFTMMVLALDRMLRSYSYEDIAAGFRAVPISAVLIAAGFVVAQYFLMCVREWLATRYADRPDIGFRRAALASTIARPLSTLGVATITGIGLRARIYNAWGFSTKDLALITTYDQISYYVGIAAMCGVVLSVSPVPWPETITWNLPATWIVGVIGLLVVVAYTVFGALRRGKSLHVRKVEIPMPDKPELAGQILLPVADLALTAAIVATMLPDGTGLSYLDLLAVCLLANLAGSLSQVPAGLGVFEAVLLQFAPATADDSAVLGALLVRRVITNLFPMMVGAILLALSEVTRRRTAKLHEWHDDTAATVLSVIVFATGVMLLLLGADASLRRAVAPGAPGPTILVILGVSQLLLARGIQHRTINAWRIAVGLIVLRLIGEFVYEVRPVVMGILAAELGLFLAFRPAFTERGMVMRADTASWWAAIAMALIGTIGAGYWASRHTIERTEAWMLIGIVATVSVVAGLVGFRFAKHGRQDKREILREGLQEAADKVAEKDPEKVAEKAAADDKKP
jgi:phosphatidylglycerol lysyltransferase